MPYTLNGVGTWYYGKNNVVTTVDTCEACKREARLTSYDTTLFFVFLFIPLIPLGRKRVLFECSHCQRHRVLSLRKWQAEKKRAVAEAVQAFRQDTRSVERAREVMDAIVAFQDPEMLAQMAPIIGEGHAGNAEILARLGTGFLVLGNFAAAEQYLKASLAAADDPEVREFLASCLISQKHPHEARTYLQHVLAKRKQDAFGLLIYLVEGYQSVGLHEYALEVLEECRDAFPAECQAKEVQKLQKLSEKHRSTGKAIKSKAVEMAQGSTKHHSGRPSRRLLLVGPAILCLAIGIYLFTAFTMGRSREVYVVNGLPRAYTVVVNGEKHKLAPFRSRAINIAEGDVSVSVADADLDIPSQTCRITTPFLGRPFLSRTFIINPDRVAVLLWREVLYTQRPAEEGPSLAYYTGKLLHEFRDIHYVFEDFPEQITIEGSSARRRGVDIVNQHFTSPIQTVAVLLIHLDRAKVLEFLERQLQYDPREDGYLFAYCNAQEPSAARAFLEPKLDAVPLLVEWHRAYQAVVEKCDPEHDLHAEYAARLARDPENPELMYLLGRVSDDEEAERLYIQAAKADPPSPHAYNALAWSRMCRGEFEKALALVRKARALAPENSTFEVIEGDLLLATERYDEIIRLTEKRLKEEEWNIEAVASYASVLARAGKKETARRAIEQYLQKLEPGVSKVELRESRDYLEALMYHAAGDRRRFVEAAKRVPSLAFYADITGGDFPAAEKILADARERDAYAHLSLYVAATAGRADSALAARSIGIAIASLRGGDKEEREVAEALISGKMSAEDMQRLLLHPGQKRIVLAALGTRIPSIREEAFALGRKLNYSTALPGLMLEGVLGSE